MQNDNIAQTIKENYKTYAEERLVPIEALREMGYTTDQAIKIAIMFELREISDSLGSPEYGDMWFILLMVAYWLKFGYVL